MQGNPYKRCSSRSAPKYPWLSQAPTCTGRQGSAQHPNFFHTKAQASSPPFPCPGAEGGWETKRRLGEANGSAPILHPRPFLHRRKQSASNAQVPQAARRFANALSDLCRVRTSPTTLIQLGGLKKKKNRGKAGQGRADGWGQILHPILSCSARKQLHSLLFIMLLLAFFFLSRKMQKLVSKYPMFPCFCCFYLNFVHFHPSCSSPGHMAQWGCNCYEIITPLGCY